MPDAGIHVLEGLHFVGRREPISAEAAYAELAELALLSPLGADAKIITHWTRGSIRNLEGQDEQARLRLRAAYSGCEELGNPNPNDHLLTYLPGASSPCATLRMPSGTFTRITIYGNGVVSSQARLKHSC